MVTTAGSESKHGVIGQTDPSQDSKGHNTKDVTLHLVSNALYKKLRKAVFSSVSKISNDSSSSSGNC